MPTPTSTRPSGALAAGDDEFLFRQGPARGLSKIRFSDWRASFEPFAAVPNVARFVELAESFKRLLVDAAPDEEQQKDLDYLLTLGELFTLIPYGQLICEQAAFIGLPTDVLDQIFDVLIRDFSAYAVQLHGKTSATEAQAAWARSAITRPVTDGERFDSVFGRVRGLGGDCTRCGVRRAASRRPRHRERRGAGRRRPRSRDRPTTRSIRRVRDGPLVRRHP